jgi:hypothetical protein
MSVRGGREVVQPLSCHQAVPAIGLPPAPSRQAMKQSLLLLILVCCDPILLLMLIMQPLQKTSRGRPGSS